MKKLIVLTTFALTLAITDLSGQESGKPGTDILKQIEESGNFEPMFPFLPTHDAPDNITNVRTWPGVDDRMAGSDGFIVTEEDHFIDATGRERRFIGTNIGMTGCFPEHEQADRLAEELTRYGINLVRMHYVSHRTPKEGYPVLNSFIEPVQLERFDYLFAKLKEKGIYVYFQLNIARKFGRVNGFENAHKLPYYKNGIDNVEPRMIQLQKQFHSEILNHVNPYTETAYKDDSVISMMELANENSLINSWFGAKFKFTALVEPYKTMMIGMWNDWLISKYRDTETMKEAWEEGIEELGDGSDILSGKGFMADFADADWKIQETKDTKVQLQYERAKKKDEITGKHFARVYVGKTTKNRENPKLYWKGLNLKKGKAYCLKFKMRADKPVDVTVRAGQAHAPWKSTGFQATARCSEEWKEFVFNFIPSISDSDIRIAFSNFKPGYVDVADVSLISGMEIRWPENQSLEQRNVDWPYKYNWLTPPRRSLDFTEFLYDLESKYFLGLYDNTKNNLNIRQPVTGTQLSYGFNQPQSKTDYCDIHGYWCHPAFPGGKWDNNHWNLRNGSVANSYGHPGSTFTKMARNRILGRPFTVSEYDHPNLNFYCAEGNIMMAAMGAFQNWSGLMQFAWILDTDFDRNHIWPMFDMCSAPQKLVHFPACYAMFVRGDVRKGSDKVVFAWPSSKEEDIKATAEKQSADPYGRHDSQLLNSLPLAVVSGVQVEESPELFSEEGRIIIRSEEDVPEAIKEAFANKQMQSGTGELIWNWQEKDAGFFMVDTKNTKVFSGFVNGRTFTYRGMRLTPGETRLNWLTLSMTLTAAATPTAKGNLLRPGTYLLAATGLVHNTDAKIVTIKEAGKISCSEPDGGQIGTGPVLCEGIEAELAFAGLRGRVKCHALGPDGERIGEVPVGTNDAGEAILKISPQYKTLWYEVIVEERK